MIPFNMELEELPETEDRRCVCNINILRQLFKFKEVLA